ncbi:MAG: trypsin-like peptidase domain-containing protein, partial [Oceanococcaceae bacterium]
MRKIILGIMACSLLGAAAAAYAHWPQTAGGQRTIAPMLEKVTPGVVNIATRTRMAAQDNPLMRDPFFRYFFDLPRPQPREGQSLGSGVIVDAAKGLVLTNHHVIDKATEISVTLSDGRTLEGELVGSDAETDIAVLRIPAQNLSAVPFGDSDASRVGDFVVAIGNPFGLGQTVTSGIISALGRSGLGIEGYEDFIQTDASINPGNSGGALVDVDGKL